VEPAHEKLQEKLQEKQPSQNRLVADQTAFNITTVVKLRGKVGVDVLANAVTAVGKRHEALRTAFTVDEAKNVPLQLAFQTPSLRLERGGVGWSCAASQGPRL
jgi:hypothetical protein